MARRCDGTSTGEYVVAFMAEDKVERFSTGLVSHETRVPTLHTPPPQQAITEQTLDSTLRN